MYSRKDLTKTTLAAAVLLALGTGAADAGTTTGGNFTMLAGNGTLTGGTNDVTFVWDGTLKVAVVTDGTNNATLSSPTPFAGSIWTAHNVNVYGPGTYVFNTAIPAGTGTQCTADCNYTLNIPAGYVGAHMLFDWNGNTNIDVVQLWKINDSWNATGGDPVGSAISPDPFCEAPYTNGSCNTVPNPNGNTRNTVFSLISIDTPASVTTRITEPTENNLYHGTKMIDGPFRGSSANFNVNLDTTPNAFTFVDQTGVTAGNTITSAPITVTKAGSPAVFAISVTGGLYSTDGGATYVSTPGIVSTGQTVRAQHTAGAGSCAQTDTTITIGGVPDTFSSTTAGAGCSDTKPDTFVLAPQTGVALSSMITSNQITVLGIAAATPVDISVSGDASSRYSVNGGACTNTSGTVVLNDTVRVCHTSAAIDNTTISTVLSIGGVSQPANVVPGTFTSTTAVATVVATDAADPNMPGCSITNTTAMRPSDHAEWWLVGGFLALLGVIRRRRV